MDKHIYLDGKVVGFVRKDTYYTNRIPKYHYYVKGGGYPISVKILNQLKDMGICYVIIIEHGKSNVSKYRTELMNYLNIESFKEGDFDIQKCFPLKKMVKISSREIMG